MKKRAELIEPRHRRIVPRATRALRTTTPLGGFLQGSDGRTLINGRPTGYLTGACITPKLNARSRVFTSMSENEQPLALVVEDETLLRLHAAGLLEEHGFAVLEAANAAEALTVLQSRGDVRLLFTDIQMPGALDGMDLVREVHARWPRVLLVIASGRIKPPQAEIPDDGRFVSKPYGAQELFREVDDLMRKSSGSD
jgi:CheY-like chemotaxis protein